VRKKFELCSIVKLLHRQVQIALGFKVCPASCPLSLSFGDKFAVLALGYIVCALPIIVECFELSFRILSAILDVDIVAWQPAY